MLFFRMGDFYELFHDDAERIAPLLGLTLTSRDKGPNAMPMAGVPVKSVTGYIKKLVALGERVAICEQVEDPRHVKGIVRREVVRVITAGTLTEDDQLTAEAPNYCAAIAPPAQRGGAVGLAWADVSTGEFVCADVPDAHLADRLAQVDPAELLLPAGLADDDPALARLTEQAVRGATTAQPPFAFGAETAERALHDHFGTATLAGFGCPDGSAGARAAGAVLRYLGETQKTALHHIRRLRYDTGRERMALDRSTQR
ncbi:MAG: MutS N-terminal domain-containing protein, partial [Planctomycetota bacterium]